MKTQLNCLHFAISHLGFRFYLGSVNILNINCVVYKINERIHFNFFILSMNNIRITGREGFASLFHYKTYVRNILQYEHFYIKSFETKITWRVEILTVLGTLYALVV